MNYNISAYIIYLICVVIIIYFVGNICYKNGGVFIENILEEEIDMAHQINKILLIGYYLLNIGYATITLVNWQQINGLNKLIEVISIKISNIALTIAILHYVNIYLVKKFAHKFIEL